MYVILAMSHALLIKFESVAYCQIRKKKKYYPFNILLNKRLLNVSV